MCCNERWEEAYRKFETEQEEKKKFRTRLVELGAESWDKRSRIVDLFCGKGTNLECLTELGFSDLHGVDLSPLLLAQYKGPSELYVGDATDIKFPDEWADIFIVQGGLHHLPRVPANLELCLAQIHRVLRPGGLLVLVEPWSTPFLSFVHWCCERKILRACWPKLDSLAIMISEEKDTYFSWLAANCEIELLVKKFFMPELWRTRFGKLEFVGSKVRATGLVPAH